MSSYKYPLTPKAKERYLALIEKLKEDQTLSINQAVKELGIAPASYCSWKRTAEIHHPEIELPRGAKLSVPRGPQKRSLYTNPTTDAYTNHNDGVDIPTPKKLDTRPAISQKVIILVTDITSLASVLKGLDQ